MRRTLVQLVAILVFGMVAECVVVAVRTVVSTHLLTKFPTSEKAFEAAKVDFSNDCDKVVITLDRNFDTGKETFTLESYKRKGTLIQ